MKKVTLIGASVIAGVIVLGVLAGLYGNVGVRRVHNTSGVVLDVSQPVIPGVPVRVQWKVDTDTQPQQVNLILRTEEESRSLGIANIQDRAVSATIPCEEGDTEAGVSLVSSITGEVLASVPLDILPAGPDCFSR